MVILVTREKSNEISNRVKIKAVHFLTRNTRAEDVTTEYLRIPQSRLFCIDFPYSDISQYSEKIDKMTELHQSNCSESWKILSNKPTNTILFVSYYFNFEFTL